MALSLSPIRRQVIQEKGSAFILNQELGLGSHEQVLAGVGL